MTSRDPAESLGAKRYRMRPRATSRDPIQFVAPAHSGPGTGRSHALDGHIVDTTTMTLEETIATLLARLAEGRFRLE